MSHKARTFKKRKLFLDALEVGDSISRAAMAAGEDASFFRRWADADKDFKRDWEEAEEAGTDFIEDAATARALEKSDPLMLAILKARRPDKYDRGSKLEVSGTINVQGSKAKLLNKLAKLKAQQKAAEERSEETKEEGGEERSEAGAEEQKLLPPPGQAFEPGIPIVRGSKRRGEDKASRRQGASA